MTSDLDSILPLVSRPIRYTGQEMGSVGPATSNGRVGVVLLMPEVYEIGMSNYGLRVLYHLVNRRTDAWCERAFTPWPDMAARLVSASLPLRSLESQRPLREFDIVGFSLQSELSYTNVLYSLQLAGIPLRSDQRTPREPLVIAGGPCCVNPLPMNPFIDAFAVGDGEEVLGDIVDARRAWNGHNRSDLLAAVARIPGVYVPLHPISGRVTRRIVSELRFSDFPIPPILPISEIVHDRLTLEIARGCCRGCRFCQAGVVNRPFRYRSAGEIVELAEAGIRSTGWEEVSLLSLSSLDYPGLLALLEHLNATLAGKRVALSLPSVRGEDFTAELAAALKTVHKTGLTFAPETASPRLRALVNKQISEERILESARAAAEAGWRGVKLYFMIGLPSETEADVAEIARLVNEFSGVGRNWTVRFNLSPFVPKPHTALQWAGFDSLPNLNMKLAGLRDRLRRRGVQAKWEDPRVSWVQAVLARGDEQVASVIEHVYRSGGVFQEWTENFSFEAWQKAFEDTGIDPAVYLDSKPADQALPWDFIDVGVSPGYLRAEAERAQAGELTPDCREAGCVECGLASCPTRVPSDAPCRNEAASDQPIVAPSAPVDYGRYRRRLAPTERLRTRFRIRYAVEEAFRYAGHLDLVRAFYRALRRSELPIAYSQGFSPRPVVAFGPPLPVGLTAQDEYLDLSMSGHYSGDPVSELDHHMPPGLRVLEARPIMAKVESLGAAIRAARYHIMTRGLSDGDLDAARARLPGIAGVLGLAPNQERSLPPYDPTGIGVVTSLAPGIKLFPLLAHLFGRTDEDVRCWRVQRVTCYKYQDGNLVSLMEEL